MQAASVQTQRCYTAPPIAGRELVRSSRRRCLAPAAVKELEFQLSKYDSAMLQKTNEGLRVANHARMPQHDGARTGWLSDFIILPQVLKACRSEGLPLSEGQLQAMFTEVEPPPDGKFIGVFLEMLEALQSLSPQPYTPPLSWLHALDEALLARSNATSWGDCSSDYENGLRRIRDLTLPVNPQELLLVLQQLVRAQASSPQDGFNGRVFMFPLAAEACIKDCGSPPELAPAMEEIEAFHAAVLNSQGSHDIRTRGTAYARSTLKNGGGIGGGRGTSTHLHWQLLVPLLRRYSECFEYQDMLALTHAALSSIEDRCSISVNLVDSKIAGTCQACLVKALGLARQGLRQHQQGAAPAAAHEGGGTTQPAPDSGRSTTTAERAAQVLSLGVEVVAWIARTTRYHGIQPYQLHAPVVEGAVGCMRDASNALAGSNTSPGQRDGLGAAPARTLDEVCHVMDHPGVLVDALVVLSHCPQAHYRTPYQAAAMLRAHLELFSDTQIMDMLQALGKLKVMLAAGQGPRGDAAGFDLLSAKVTGDPAQQGLLTWEGRVPDDVAQRHPQRGPACDEDPSLDLLTRIGLRLSRALSAQSPAQRAVTLQQLGVLR